MELISISEHPGNVNIRARNERKMKAGQKVCNEITDVMALYYGTRHCGWLNRPPGREPGLAFFTGVTPEVEAEFRREAEKLTGAEDIKAGHAPELPEDEPEDDEPEPSKIWTPEGDDDES